MINRHISTHQENNMIFLSNISVYASKYSN